MSFENLNIPSSSATVTVKMFDIVDDPRQVKASSAAFIKPVAPGFENMALPVFAFLVENATTNQKVLFDLGPRKDLENAAPGVAEAVKAGYMAMPVSKDIVEQLAQDGVQPQHISAVIWSHSHVDHTGDMTKFPSTTELVLSKDVVTETYKTNPRSTLLPSDLAGHKLVRADFDATSLVIGEFKALDYFKDGSFYLLYVPGHQAGHLCALARVTPTSFVFLGADACHHAGVLRPTAALHRHVPCPGELIAAARSSISHTHIHAPESTESAFDLSARTTPLLDITDEGYFEDPPKARESVHKIAAFDSNADVFVVVAHDESLGPVIGPFPTSLDQWQAKGWKKAATWAFVDENNPAFRFNGAGPKA
ncbi:beta-lactamase-like protein [Mycena alexandri]|uniref:Beta-lactamase-like protein n=1 Tax=Mycena alexandri TaxID=1745969 RepID=A0AAD6XC30_9AGAR|nr:beta-lactamase-like protein [Mycena alexandri]